MRHDHRARREVGEFSEPITTDVKPTIYRRHNCGRRHRTYRTLAECVWRGAWTVVTGEGPYAVVWTGPYRRVHLFATEDEAAHAYDSPPYDWSSERFAYLYPEYLSLRAQRKGIACSEE